MFGFKSQQKKRKEAHESLLCWKSCAYFESMTNKSREFQNITIPLNVRYYMPPFYLEPR